MIDNLYVDRKMSVMILSILKYTGPILECVFTCTFGECEKLVVTLSLLRHILLKVIIRIGYVYMYAFGKCARM